MSRTVLAAVVFSLLVAAVPASGAEPLSGLHNDQPIEITAQQLEAFETEGKTIFSGDVVAVQGEFELRCEQLTVFFDQQQNQLRQLEAVGSVKITQQDKTATANKAVYRQADQVLLLQGQAELVQGENRISGDEITFDLVANKSVVTSSPAERVKAVITPPKKQGKKE